ncbi:MAG: mechanosensitive ion channel [Gammaproteobacteria bacterium]|nr:mechanosensitive ion channel [Gammaproteobacteria bacterium]MCP5198773.1 mechanosensitive ion channel [Gammaproteobacteria bacterium]
MALAAPELLPAALRATAIVVLAVGVHVVVRRGVRRLRGEGRLSENAGFIARALSKWGLTVVVLLSVMQQFGVSVHTLWTALSAVFVMVAVGFVAMWSVLSNMLCALFLVVFAPFRIGDRIEIIEVTAKEADKRGLRGKVTGMDLIYTTLLDEDDRSTIRVPNNLLFQRAIRTVSGADTRSLGSDLFDQRGVRAGEPESSGTRDGGAS